MPHKRKLNAVTEDLICEAYEKHGRTLRELATFHFVTPGTVRNILKRHSVSRRKRGRRKGVKYERI